MELAHMGSLYNVLRNPTFTPSWESTFDFGLEAAEGMAFLHSLQPPLLHRDLKTLNLMVTNQMKIKVGDFGLSIFDVAAKGDGGVTGTAAYLAPETLEGVSFTIRADVYAFAVVFWELVNTTLKQEYQAPFEEYKFTLDMQILFAVSSRDLRPSLPKSCPPEVTKFLDTCWNKTPEERPDFPTLVQQLRDLRSVFNDHKAAWNATIGQSWLEEGATPRQSETAQDEITTTEDESTAITQAETTSSTNPTAQQQRNGITKSVSSSQVTNNTTNSVFAPTLKSGRSRTISDAGNKQSVIAAEFSFKREK